MEIEGASTQIPYGTDQLSGVARFTEQEIHRVLGFAEKALASHDKLLIQWDGLKGDLRQGVNSAERRNRRFSDLEAALGEEKKTLMDLMTALSFQDVAAQWLKKISSDMNGVQSRIKKLNGSLNPRGIDSSRQTAPERAEMADTFSKTAGRFSGVGKMAQADVDRLLKEHGL
ncbi:MAG: protein phosphatase CheZ [Nitrospirae bacterium]|nr:protein phosphatase CheZ [Candidatus Manganitrophaceae bacterium]